MIISGRQWNIIRGLSMTILRFSFSRIMNLPRNFPERVLFPAGKWDRQHLRQVTRYARRRENFAKAFPTGSMQVGVFYSIAIRHRASGRAVPIVSDTSFVVRVWRSACIIFVFASYQY